MTIRRKKIRAITQHLLTESDVSEPPVPIEKIARARGADIRVGDLAPQEAGIISGFLFREQGKAIIGVNADHHPNRQRFTVAHELGHLMLHTDGDMRIGDVHVDRGFHLRSETSAEGTDPVEVEANLFAAEILMPEHFLRREMRPIDPLDDIAAKKLARRYGVSVQAMTFRLANLGIVKPDLG